jgi:hypothetical protein
MELTKRTPFTPRHMRKKFRKLSGDSGAEKGKAFRRAKQVSDKFIHQPASALEGVLSASYAGYKKRCGPDGGGLR